MIRALIASVVLLALLAGRASAEHELFYRYTVLGYVKDARGKPVPGQSVELVRDKTGFSYLADTDASGLFVIVARLGDESAGERLTLRVGRATHSLLARFDPANHTDERGTRVDREGATFIDRAPWFPSTLANFLGPSRN